jgi:hypothetical protein
MKTLLATGLVFALALAGHAYAAQQICKYIDGEGRVTFSDSPQKNARKLMCFDPLPESRPSVPPKAAAGKAGPNESRFPRVDSNTQKRRDGDRRRILEQELADEQKLLEGARAALADGESVRYANETGDDKLRERIRPLREALGTHEKNIEAIRRELANTK